MYSFQSKVLRNLCSEPKGEWMALEDEAGGWMSFTLCTVTLFQAVLTAQLSSQYLCSGSAVTWGLPKAGRTSEGHLTPAQVIRSCSWSTQSLPVGFFLLPFSPYPSKDNVWGSLKSNSCRNPMTCAAFCRKKSFLAVLFDYSKGAALFALCYPVQVFININNGTSVIRKFLCLHKVLKKVWSQYVDANFQGELWKDFWLTLAQKLLILLLY